MNYKLLLITILLGLAISQDSSLALDPLTGIRPLGCSRPCYGYNVSPCKNPGDICQKSSNIAVSSFCQNLCLPLTLSKAEHLNRSIACTEPCDVIPYYKCSKFEQCNYHPELGGCYNCDPYCQLVNCFVDPCQVDTAGRACAMAVSPNAVCQSNYCGGCNAEWYLEGRRICQLAGQVICKPCPILCPISHKYEINETTGCVTCRCIPICTPRYCPLIYCPYGYETDENGCQLCKCKICPPLCKIYCKYGNKIDPVTGCKLCQCNPDPCPIYRCYLNVSACPYGEAQDANGCPLCRCRSSPCPMFKCPLILDCPYGMNRNEEGCITCGCRTDPCPLIKCSTNCLFGYIRDKNGCQTCQCAPPCFKYCPYGYTYTNNYATCKCNCLPKICLHSCPYGYEIDEYGCQSCTCKKKIILCPDVICAIYCPNGNVEDANGCPTCSCKPDLPVAAVNKTVCLGPQPCALRCIYGYQLQTVPCGPCRCVPCPLVTCARYCLYGFKTDDHTGCPSCICNPIPICPRMICPVACKYGYRKVNGCPTCLCNPTPPCVCGHLPTYAILCPDKVHTAGYNNLCVRLPNGKCGYLFRKCPIIITTTVPIYITVTDIYIMLKLVNIPSDPSIVITLTSTTSTQRTYKITIPADLLPNYSTGNTTIIVSNTEKIFELYSAGTSRIEVIQSYDAITEDDNNFNNTDNITPDPSMNGNGRIIFFIGLLVTFLML